MGLILCKIIFFISLFSLAYHYLIYPLILKLISLLKKINYETYSENELPTVSILMSVYNEQDVLDKKIKSILKTNYPKNKIEILICSDASNDHTDKILENWTKKNESIKIFIRTERYGKPQNINYLATKAQNQILILSDANVLFTPATIYEMMKYFKDKRIGLVDSKMQNTEIANSGISVQESFYIKWETQIKTRESETYGYMMGPFGGCFAIRKSLYLPVPSNFLVDDFYLNMKVLEQNYKSINSLQATVYEDVSSILKEEFRRKARIGTGNFQNLFVSRKILFSNKIMLSFFYFSHKILRWFGWLFLLLLLLSNLALYSQTYYQIFLYIYLFSIFVSIIDGFFRLFDKQILFLRFITHFYGMNLALFTGFIKFLKGVKTNVWQPTKRNQSK